MRLLRVELRRLFARRLVVLAMLGAVLISLATLLGVWSSTRPLSDAELAQAEQFYQEELAYWAEHGEEQIADCRLMEAEESERLGEAVDFGCDDMEPRLEWFVHTAPSLDESFAYQLAAFGLLPLLAALVVGATFTAAELSTGSLSTWLSFEPRRLRVYLSKVLAVAIGIAPVTVVALAVVVLGTWAINAQVGLADGMTSAVWIETLWTTLRIAALAVLAAVAAAALGILLRHTAAVLGVVIGYGVVEMIAGQLVQRAQPWLVSTNISGWIQGGTTYYVEDCTLEASGMMCEYVDRALPLAHSVVYLLVLVVLVVVLGAVVFRRRDAA